jgi:intracellular sulfur oxidation DsrE/DsrF family protein
MTMKRMLAVACLALLTLGFVREQQAPSYRVVFDLTSRDSLEQKAVLRWIKEITAENPKAQMEVVMYGKGFELVMPERSALIADVQEAMKNPNVSFKVCDIALRNNGVDKSKLAPGVQTVPDGIYEIISKQQQHWGYIKVMH